MRLLEQRRLSPLAPTAGCGWPLRQAVELLVIGRARRPQHRRSSLLARCALLACLVERSAKAADDQAAHRRRIAEAHLGLRRVDVDVDLFERHRQEQRRDRMAVARDQVAVGAAQARRRAAGPSPAAN